MFVHSSVVDNYYYYCDNMSENSYCVVHDWFFDSINNKIIFVPNNEKTRQINTIIKNIIATLRGETIWAIKFFQRNGKEYIYINILPSAIIYEINANNYLLKYNFNRKNVQDIYLSDACVIEEYSEFNKIYDDDIVYQSDKLIRSKLYKMHENMYYYTYDNKLFLLDVKEKIKEMIKIDIRDDEQIIDLRHVMQKIYMIIENNHDAYILSYNIGTKTYEYEHIAYNIDCISKFGNLLVFGNDTLFNGKYHIISQKNNVKQINLYDTHFKFV